MSDPEQMYRLHRYFSEIELQRTYDEIAKLQVSRFPGVTNLTWISQKDDLCFSVFPPGTK